jgi:hypothetical protein
MTSRVIDTGSVLALLERHGPAVMVEELRAHGAADASSRSLNQALQRLEAEGAIIVREYAWPDPHIEGVDLRIAGLLQPVAGKDAVSACIERIEAVWTEWLAAYLAEHRCS